MLFAAARTGPNGLATLDVNHDRYRQLDALVLEPDVRAAVFRVFELALGNIEVVAKG